MLKEPPRLLKAFLLGEAIKRNDWVTIQQLSRSPDRAIQGMAYEAADLVSEEIHDGIQWNSMGTDYPIEHEKSTLNAV